MEEQSLYILTDILHLLNATICGIRWNMEAHDIL